jgi:hypothetical protein
MQEPKTDRSNCRFVVQGSRDGKITLVVELYQDTIPAFSNVVLGFDLLGGMRVEQAKKLAETLNEHVLNLFVTVRE